MGVLEQYNLNTNAWASIDSPPLISSLAYTGSATAADPAGGETITVTGSNFQSGATVKVGETSATSVTVVSTTSITFTTPAKTAGDYDVVVTNANGLDATLSNGISYNGVPAFTTAAGNLGELVNNEAMSTITIVVAEPDGGGVTQSITSGRFQQDSLFHLVVLLLVHQTYQSQTVQHITLLLLAQMMKIKQTLVHLI